jgi:hypothetical protein
VSTGKLLDRRDLPRVCASFAMRHGLVTVAELADGGRKVG